MTTPSQSALTWQDGAIPVSTRFDDPYFSKNDGLSETRHVFLQGNDLPARLTPGFHAAELGFGTGLNLLALSLITKTPTRFTSFEAFPLATADIARALEHFPEARAIADPFLSAWSLGQTRFQLGPITAEIILGDARETLAAWPHKADAWFLDGFSPAKNPELWSPEILTEVARHTAPQGTFATYTAAGHVRRALQDAGFQVERRPGHGSKKHMSAGTLR
ncbi:MAG: tRNA (5-methylaminomethyl-2-thiouridine)(34)-methyltransferase MnmD [Cypionkella sp.]|uniref:tRNA (5-methylaminomethyl-2-thiouridine)(34)-methyltransferase MnmD n=1 Tax=Cypionkella sp. TaxID=2811411 RepID=UPI00272F08AB|nr:tRNA (5-methylaminomethyl-2-thiouridine)(34)-methyltransferase MnmD [Cypionkella sp.]MDP2047434.1 tRNA (5-methylaminomethyl-2-thiouridine)(34)-methyltransferase MnmD [Cypionkella sp.]